VNSVWPIVGIVAGVAAVLAAELGKATAADVVSGGEFSPDWVRNVVTAVGLFSCLSCALMLTLEARGRRVPPSTRPIAVLAALLALAGVLLIIAGPHTTVFD
jgi:hypothetical protein